MNRQQKRMMQRQGMADAEGNPVGKAQGPRPTPRPVAKEEQLGLFARIGRYISEVASEFRKVVWPSRADVLRYSLVVTVTLIVITALIFGLDVMFSQLTLKLFNI